MHCSQGMWWVRVSLTCGLPGFLLQMRAMVLEPLVGDQTWTVVDGEAVPNVLTYLEVHPQLCTALVSRGLVHHLCRCPAAPGRVSLGCTVALHTLPRKSNSFSPPPQQLLATTLPTLHARWCLQGW